MSTENTEKQTELLHKMRDSLVNMYVLILNPEEVPEEEMLQMLDEVRNCIEEYHEYFS